MRKRIFFIALFFILFAQNTEATHVNCGNTIYSDTILDSDLLNCQYDGIIMGSNFITLDCNNFLIKGNGETSMFFSGVFDPISHHVTIKNCKIQNFHKGINIENMAQNLIINNSLSENRYGISITGPISNFILNNTIRNNIITSNNFYGILFARSANHNNVDGNIIKSNGLDGIRFKFQEASPKNNKIINNLIDSNNENGIFLDLSENNTIAGNTIINSLNGIYISSASNNIIYNNFFGNSNNALDNGFNFWNIEQRKEKNIIGGAILAGNFWRDYMGEDLDGNGIGDTDLPYNSGNNINNGGDNYPLVSKVISGSLSPKEKLDSGYLFLIIALVILLAILFLRHVKK